MSDDRTLAVVAHLSGFLSFVGPLLIWALKKDESKFVAEQSLEALNFQISVLIYSIVAGFSMFLFIGILLLPVIIIASIVFAVMAAVAANKGESYKYPFTLRLIN